jgi:hypothetical protein
MPRSLEGQIRATYFSLRVILAVLAFTLPPLLYIGGHLRAHIPLRDSMSAYYWAAPGQICQCSCTVLDTEKCPAIEDNHWTDKQRQAWIDQLKAGTMRNYFVGFLFAVGAILYVYKGYTWKENWALNFAGVMAVSVALNPMPWDCAKHHVTAHGASAILFFVAIAYVCIFQSDDTLVLIKDTKRRAFYKGWYRVLGIIMACSPIFAFIYTAIRQRYDHYIFSAEMAGIYAFSAYWVVKIREIQFIGERRALERLSDPNIPG